jgi:hypothetical protein
MLKSLQSPLLIAATTLLLITGCGKVASPKAPEYFAPEIVGEYAVTPSVGQGIIISWKAPKNDRNGKELKTMDGYSVERATLEEGDTVATAKFSEIAFIHDGHILERDKLRAELRAQHKPSRSADVKSEKKMFSYTDSSPEANDPSLHLMYRVIGINQDGVKGARTQIAYKKGDALVYVNNEDGADLLAPNE